MTNTQRENTGKIKKYWKSIGVFVEGVAVSIAVVDSINGKVRTLDSLMRQHVRSKKSILNGLVTEIHASGPKLELLNYDDVIDVMGAYARLLTMPEEKTLVLITRGRDDIDHGIQDLEALAGKLGSFSKQEQEKLGKILESTLLKLNDSYKEHSYEYRVQVRLSSPKNKSIEKVINNRVNVKLSNSLLLISGKVFGSTAKASDLLRNDLALTILLLEFEGIIYESNKKTNAGALKVEIIVPESVHPSLTLTIIRNYYNSIDEKYAAGTAPRDVEVFELLSNSDSKTANTLRFVLNFFSSEKTRLPSFEFLKYWMAVEILGGSPETGIEKTLYYELSKKCPQLIDANDFHVLYKLRCGIVHRGKIDIDVFAVGKMKTMAKTIFTHVLREEFLSKKVSSSEDEAVRS